MYIKVRYKNDLGKIVEAVYSRETFDWWIQEERCIDIMDYETGEILYIKGQ